jgi:hypothetical protein
MGVSELHALCSIIQSNSYGPCTKPTTTSFFFTIEPVLSSASHLGYQLRLVSAQLSDCGEFRQLVKGEAIEDGEIQGMSPESFAT